MTSEQLPVPLIDERNLRVTATMGRGAFGLVKQGVLDGRLVCIKVQTYVWNGFGKMHACTQSVSQSLFAIGSPTAKVAETAAVMTRLSRLATLCHTNIVKFYGICMDVSIAPAVPKYAVFELANSNLSSYLASLHRSMAIDEQLSLAIDVLSGLEYLHSQTPPLVHGNLKPSNVLVFSSPDGAVCFKLSNTSLSHFAVSTMESYYPTHNGDCPQYLAPEGNRSCAADMYAFGVMMSEVMVDLCTFLGVVVRGCCPYDKYSRFSATEALELLRRGECERDEGACSESLPETVVLHVVECKPWEIRVGWSAAAVRGHRLMCVSQDTDTCEFVVEDGLETFVLDEFNGYPLEPNESYTFRLLIDGAEVPGSLTASTLPVTGNVCVMGGRYPRIFTLHPVLFYQNTDAIIPGTDVSLPEVASLVKSRDFGGNLLSIEGHTNRGNMDEEAVELSKVCVMGILFVMHLPVRKVSGMCGPFEQKRARQVCIRLLSLGVQKHKMKTTGWGCSKPKWKTGSLNRRVEFWVVLGDKPEAESCVSPPASVWELDASELE